MMKFNLFYSILCIRKRHKLRSFGAGHFQPRDFWHN
jgi:hypothetical protein